MVLHPTVVPGTELGRWSLGLIAAFAGGLTFFGVAVWAGERGGDDFFDNMWLTGPVLFAYAAAVGATATGLLAVFGKKERAVPVFLAVLLGGFVTLFGILEVAFPH